MINTDCIMTREAFGAVLGTGYFIPTYLYNHMINAALIWKS